MNTKTVCPSCETLKIEEPILNTKRATWLKERNHSKDFINRTPLKIKKQLKYDFTKHINIGAKNKNKYVLYWASDKTSNNIDIKKAKEAYNNFSNYGVAIVDKSGNFKIYIQVPQNYSDINDKNEEETYYKHIHFVLSDVRKKTWELNEIYTYLIVPNYNFQSFIRLVKSNNAIILNSSSFRDYSMSHIPNTYNLPFNELYDMNNKEIDEWMLKLIQKNYLTFKDVLYYYAQKGNITKFREKIHEFPIIIYNNDHNKKDILEKYAENLIHTGFVNICIYTGGLSEYYINKPINTKTLPSMLLVEKYTLKRKKKRKYYSIKKN